MSPLQGSIEEQPKIIGPASTLKLVGKGSDVPALTESDPGVVPKGKHWVDMTDEGTVVVIEQPPGQTCAALGGIMATRMKVRGVKACIVGGRVRDLAELRKSGLSVSDKQTNCTSTSRQFALALTFLALNALFCPHPLSQPQSKSPSRVWRFRWIVTLICRNLLGIHPISLE
jgi:regulator of RNase E activity RraA